MSIIGIDPASRCGYAYRTRDGWKCGTVNAFDLHALLAVFSDALSAGVTDACVEDCYLGLNVSTLKSLANIQGRVCGALEAVGITVRLVQPRSWKSAMLLEGGIPVAGREAQKSKGMEVARRLGASPATDDESDAVCLSEFGASTGMQTMLPTGPHRAAKANAARAKAMKGVPYAPKGERRIECSGTNSTTTCEDQKEHKTRAARAKAANVDTGTVAKVDTLVNHAPDLAPPCSVPRHERRRPPTLTHTGRTPTGAGDCGP